MIERLPYTKNTHNLISLKNQSWFDLNIQANIKLYPDMYQTYKSFANIFCLSLQNFILTNGCQNALKSALLAIKPSSLYFDYPSWQMLQVITTACNIPYIKKQIKFQNNILYSNCSQQADWYYTTLGRNNWFKYNDSLIFQHCGKRIIDVSYFNIQQIKEIIIKYPQDIICGSFDKLFGPGLRLGFCIYPKQYNNKFQLQRQQYINALASNFLIENYIRDYTYKFPLYMDKFKSLPIFLCMTNNYMTFKGNLNTNIISKKVSINNQYFTRFGIPQNAEIANILFQELNICLTHK